MDFQTPLQRHKANMPVNLEITNAICTDLACRMFDRRTIDTDLPLLDHALSLRITGRQIRALEAITKERFPSLLGFLRDLHPMFQANGPNGAPPIPR